MPRRIREIMSKAVIAKGNIRNQESYAIETVSQANSVLGCWIINHQFTSMIDKGKLYIEGSFDINLWYASEEGSKSEVGVKTVNYKDELEMTKQEEILDKELHMSRAHCVLSPVCKDATVINEHEIEVQIEKEFSCDVIGDAFIRVEVIEDDEETNEHVDVIDFNIQENFIEG